MKTLFQTISMVCIVLILFSTGCEKKESSGSVQSVSIEEPANPRNPYDGFGYLHNSILDYVQEKRKLTGSLNFDLSCESIRKYYQAKSFPELRKGDFDLIPQIVNDAATNIFQLIQHSKWSDSTKDRLSELLRRLEDLSFDSCSFPQLKTTIIDFENDILDGNLASHEREAILKISSLARFSGYRWLGHPNSARIFDQNQLTQVHQVKGINPLTIVTKETPNAQSKLFKKVGKWFAVTACDIGGAIADMSVASGAATSDYMSAILDLH